MEQPNHSGANDGSDAKWVEGHKELDVDHHVLNNEDMLRRIFRNDPSVVGVNVYPHGDAEAIDWWGRVGNAIGANTHVKSLLIDSFFAESSASLESFCRGVANNRSIERLKINECDLITRDIFPALSPFFEHNSNLRSIVINYSSLGSRRAPSFASALTKCDKNTLKRISLDAVHIGEKAMAEFIGALSHHHGLVNLSLICEKMGRNGCAALANLIDNSEMKLQKLSLRWCKSIDDECMSILGNVLGRSNTIRRLDLSDLNYEVRRDGSDGPITFAGWCTVLAAVGNPMCSLEELRLRHMSNKLGDQCLVALGHALVGNTKLTCLDISGSKTVTATSWRAFCECLQSPTSALEKLHIAQCDITDEGAITMATALMTNKTLKCLDISANLSITPAGWRACFNLLKNSTLRLEVLNLDSNDIDDHGVAALVEVFALDNTLKILNLSRCLGISAIGWQQIPSLLQHPSTALAELSLKECVNDEVIIRYSSALLNNSMLKVLRFGGHIFGDHISARGWGTLSSALCNTSSISDTHSSNHSLAAFYPADLPPSISRLLKMNRNENKREVARQKILEHHFRDPETDIRVFSGLEWKALPHAIEWIGRDYLGFSLLYHLTRSMASLFESDVKPNVALRERKLEC